MYKLLNNHKGQKIFVSMMVAILVFIVLVIIVSPLRQETIKATNGTFSTHLNTSNPNLAVEHRATVIVIDMALFYFVAILIGCSVAYVSGRRSFTAVVTSIMIFVVASVIITPLKSLIVLARDSSHLNCASATTVGQSLSCIFVDIWLFYFVVVLLFTAATFIFVKTTSKEI